MDATVLKLFNVGIAASTHKTYRAALTRFQAFCTQFGIVDPLPVNELLICHFVLASEGLSPAAIKTYLAGIRHTQVSLGHPEPCAAGALPRLKLVQSGAAKELTLKGVIPSKQHLPITPRLLHGLINS